MSEFILFFFLFYELLALQLITDVCFFFLTVEDLFFLRVVLPETGSLFTLYLTFKEIAAVPQMMRSENWTVEGKKGISILESAVQNISYEEQPVMSMGQLKVRCELCLIGVSSEMWLLRGKQWIVKGKKWEVWGSEECLLSNGQWKRSNEREAVKSEECEVS